MECVHAIRKSFASEWVLGNSRGCNVAVHVKDVDSAGGNTVLGEGTIDLPGVFAALAETKFDGLLVLEYEGDFDDMKARLEGMRRSLEVMRKLITASASPSIASR